MPSQLAKVSPLRKASNALLGLGWMCVKYITSFGASYAHTNEQPGHRHKSAVRTGLACKVAHFGMIMHVGGRLHMLGHVALTLPKLCAACMPQLSKQHHRVTESSM